jgi:tetratricopeptide (TPR) repeat protein
MKARRLVLAIMLVAVFSLGLQAHAGPPEVDALMQESFQQFDQSPDSRWRVLLLQSKYSEGIALIQDYRGANSAKLLDWQKASLAFHLGDLYALAGDREQAIAAYRQSLAFNAAGNPAYIQAFIAFLGQDRVALLKAREALATAQPAAWQKGDVAVVDELIKYFGQPYEAVFGAMSCVDKTVSTSASQSQAYCQTLLEKYAAVYKSH